MGTERERDVDRDVRHRATQRRGDAWKCPVARRTGLTVLISERQRVLLNFNGRPTTRRTNGNFVVFLPRLSHDTRVGPVKLVREQNFLRLFGRSVIGGRAIGWRTRFRAHESASFQPFDVNNRRAHWLASPPRIRETIRNTRQEFIPATSHD